MERWGKMMELQVEEDEEEPWQPFGSSSPRPRSPESTNEPSVGPPERESTEGVGELMLVHFI
jgi:hypothetical protein